MNIIAESKSINISPRKIRLVADAARKLTLDKALLLLAAAPKRAALPLSKTMKSAIANAVNNARLERSSLVLKAIEITEGPALKRYHPSTRGRIHPYKKRTSNIRVVLETVEPKHVKEVKKEEE